MNDVEHVRPSVDFLNGTYLPMEDVLPVRQVLWDQPDLLDRFAADPRTALSESDRALVGSWKHRVRGKFILLRHRKDHSVFMGGEKENRGVYAVRPLLSPFDEVVGPYLPVAVEGVLLPFEEGITYDGLLESYRLSFGPGIRRSFQEDYEKTLARGGLITSLPPRPATPEPSQLLPHVRRRNRTLLEGFRRRCYTAGLSSRTVEKETAWITAFAEGVLLHAHPPRSLDDMVPADERAPVPTPTGGSSPSPEAWSRALARFRQYLEDRPFL